MARRGRRRLRAHAYGAPLAGPAGAIVFTDHAQAQLDCARARAQDMGLDRIRFEVADASVGLADAGRRFDVVYARFLLVHLPEPAAAVAAMARHVAPEGLLWCEEHDVGSIAAVPPSPAVERCKTLLDQIQRHRGVDYTFGTRLGATLTQAGMKDVHTWAQNFSYALPESEPKRLLEYSIREGRSAYEAAGFIAPAEMDHLLTALRAYAERDDTTVWIGNFYQALAFNDDWPCADLGQPKTGQLDGPRDRT